MIKTRPSGRRTAIWPRRACNIFGPRFNVARAIGRGLGRGLAVGLGVGTGVAVGVGLGLAVGAVAGVGVGVGDAVGPGLADAVAVGRMLAVGLGVVVFEQATTTSSRVKIEPIRARRRVRTVSSSVIYVSGQA
jgi:hypothetical protein